MLAARLHGPADVRIEELPHPGAPAAGEALLRVRAVGICGSDLHTYKAGRIGDTASRTPLVPGHEFAGTVEAVGEGAADGMNRPLKAGALVAVDPAQSCGRCDLCERGHPNLCRDLKFLGLWPDDGAMRQWMLVPARCCFPVPARRTGFQAVTDSLEGCPTDPAEAATLEALGVAIHAIDLAKIGIGDRVAVLGCGPIGLCLVQLARLAGAAAVYATDKFAWRLKLAERFGAKTFDADSDPVTRIAQATSDQGADVAIEAAWADHSVQQAADMLRPGGRMVLVGIPEDDRLVLRHSTARRKGLTIRMSRRMKHAYPRAIELLGQGKIDLASLISHRIPLAQAAKAFAMNAAYESGVVKVVVEI